MLITSPFAARLRAAAPLLLGWTKRRAAERSTWIGLASCATALGYSTLGDRLTSAATIVPMILGAGGAALAAASTSPRPAGGAVEQLPPA